MNGNDERYVAHYDILGFKSAIHRNQKEAWGALCDLRACMDRMLNRVIIQLPKGDIIANHLKAFIFSDSILIFTLSSTPDDYKSIIVLSTQLFYDALVGCLPLRGGISFGKFYFNLEKHLFCGCSFVNAYQIGESAKWSGIVVDKHIASEYTNYPDLLSNGKPTIIERKIPISNFSKKKMYVINWPLVFKSGIERDMPIGVEDYYQAFTSLYGPFRDLPKKEKRIYINTVKFINDVLS